MREVGARKASWRRGLRLGPEVPGRAGKGVVKGTC